MKKRIVAVLLAIGLIMGMAGCSSNKEMATGADIQVSSYASNYEGMKTDGSAGAYIETDRMMAVANTNSGTGRLAADAEPSAYAYCTEAEEDFCIQIGGEVVTPDWNTEEYRYQAENPWMSAAVSPFSTFAADVDTASYANVRRMLVRGQNVPADAVRIEEMVNYFRYSYPEPKEGEPFSVTTELAPCPWNSEAKLLMVGLNAKQLDNRERPKSNLVFLVDVSGSMDTPEKLPLVQRAFKLLCEELGPEDRVSLVTYATGDRKVLEGVSGSEKAKICDAVEDLFASGGTNGSAGIQTAYELAEKYFIKDGNNRVILATDGDLNIGITDEGSLTRLIQDKAKSGVFLSVLGFGWGNLSDARMEALADHGNGNYSYIDNIAEARKVLIDEMGGTLFTVAKDVKLQVEFNPAMVKGYRLIGYENRVMAAEDFADDTKDGGEIGAGHQVTALYEVALKGSGQEIPEVESRYGSNVQDNSSDFGKEYLTVNVRYKEPDGDTSKLLVYPVDASAVKDSMSANLSWAAGVAQAGMLLKKSEYAGTTRLDDVIRRMEKTSGAETDDYRKEFLYLLSRADISQD